MTIRRWPSLRQRCFVLAVILVVSGCSESANDESATVATIGGTTESTQIQAPAEPGSDESPPPAEEPKEAEADAVNETPQNTAAPVTVAEPPDLNSGLDSVGYGEQSGVPVTGCTGIEPGWETRRVVNVEEFLNIRNSPGGDVVMRVAPGFEIFALVSAPAGSADASKQPQVLDGAPWVMVELPGSADGPAPYGCGWVHGNFISSPNGGTFASNYLGTDVVVSVGAARCSTGSDVVYGGSNANVSFAFCANDAGTMEYHGVSLSTGSDIRLSACRLFDDVYIADNGGYTYEGVDERGTSANSRLYITDPDGVLILDELFPAATGSSGANRSLRSC